MSRKVFLSSKRDRVKGKGPDRRLLPSFLKIGKINSKISKEVLEIVDSFRSINDNYTDDFSISKFCNLGKTLPKNHTTLLLQKPFKGSSGMNEKDYTDYDKLKNNSLLKQFLKEKFSEHYRARIAILPAKSEIDWHIDMNTSVSCRFHILIKNKDIVFKINRKGHVDNISFQEGAIYFTNTAYPHCVCNPTNEDRISLLLDVEYNNIKNLLPTIEDD